MGRFCIFLHIWLRFPLTNVTKKTVFWLSLLMWWKKIIPSYPLRYTNITKKQWNTNNTINEIGGTIQSLKVTQNVEPQKTDLTGRKKGKWTGILFPTKFAWFHKDLLHSTTNLLFFIFQNPIQEGDDGVLKKGLLWQQRDKLFSRWKERYFILTKDYFHCFKKATSRITEMGGFIFKVLFSSHSFSGASAL